MVGGINQQPSIHEMEEKKQQKAFACQFFTTYIHGHTEKTYLLAVIISSRIDFRTRSMI